MNRPRKNASLKFRGVVTNMVTRQTTRNDEWRTILEMIEREEAIALTTSRSSSSSSPPPTTPISPPETPELMTDEAEKNDPSQSPNLAAPSAPDTSDEMEVSSDAVNTISAEQMESDEMEISSNSAASPISPSSDPISTEQTEAPPSLSAFDFVPPAAPSTHEEDPTADVVMEQAPPTLSAFDAVPPTAPPTPEEDPTADVVMEQAPSSVPTDYTLPTAPPTPDEQPTDEVVMEQAAPSVSLLPSSPPPPLLTPESTHPQSDPTPHSPISPLPSHPILGYSGELSAFRPYIPTPPPSLPDSPPIQTVSEWTGPDPHSFDSIAPVPNSMYGNAQWNRMGQEQNLQQLQRMQQLKSNLLETQQKMLEMFNASQQWESACAQSHQEVNQLKQRIALLENEKKKLNNQKSTLTL